MKGNTSLWAAKETVNRFQAHDCWAVNSWLTFPLSFKSHSVACCLVMKRNWKKITSQTTCYLLDSSFLFLFKKKLKERCPDEQIPASGWARKWQGNQPLAGAVSFLSWGLTALLVPGGYIPRQRKQGKGMLEQDGKKEKNGGLWWREILEDILEDNKEENKR